jgi:hypothetical protein
MKRSKKCVNLIHNIIHVGNVIGFGGKKLEMKKKFKHLSTILMKSYKIWW